MQVFRYMDKLRKINKDNPDALGVFDSISRVLTSLVVLRTSGLEPASKANKYV